MGGGVGIGGGGCFPDVEKCLVCLGMGVMAVKEQYVVAWREEHVERLFELLSEVCIYIYIVFVLFCFILFCFVLFCFVLFCFVLFCFVLFCFVLFCFVLFNFILFYI